MLQTPAATIAIQESSSTPYYKTEAHKERETVAQRIISPQNLKKSSSLVKSPQALVRSLNDSKKE